MVMQAICGYGKEGNLVYITIHQFRVTEVGAMNLFVYWKNENGEDEVVTCPTHPTDIGEDSLVLPGVTRMSVIKLISEMKNVKMSVRNYTIFDLINSVKEKRIYEMWGSGTAAAICPVTGFWYKDVDYEIPIDEKLGSGPFTNKVY